MKKEIKEEKKNLKPQKTKLFWLYFVASALLITLGIFLLPVWSNSNVFFKDWSNNSIDIILAILIVLYVVFYLLKKVKNNDLKKSKGLKLVKIIEICLLFVLSIFCVLEQFKVTNFIGPCFVVGCILYFRGLVLGINSYLYTHKKSETYSVIQLILMFLALTLGTILMIHPFYGETFMWVVSLIILVISLIILIYGLISIPRKKKIIGEIE